jgi:hypothetical protein
LASFLPFIVSVRFQRRFRTWSSLSTRAPAKRLGRPLQLHQQRRDGVLQCVRRRRIERGDLVDAAGAGCAGAGEISAQRREPWRGRV